MARFPELQTGLLDTWSRAVYLVAMPFRRRLTLLVVGAIALLAPLAHASPPDPVWIAGFWDNADYDDRSEEHTSELQSQSNLVCRLLLEKKKIIYRMIKSVVT